MKTLLISDIHSNIVALEAIWAKEKDCDQVICAGDLVDYGLWPSEVIAWIQAHNVPCVMGNHDSWVAENYHKLDEFAGLPETEQGWGIYTAKCLNGAEVEFLEALPDKLEVEIDGVGYGMRHLVGDFRQTEEIESIHAFDTFTAKHFPSSPDRLILGHTHRQVVRYLSNDQLWINPGSVSYRRRDDPDSTAHYMTVVDGEINFHRLGYDREPLRQAFKQVVLDESVKLMSARIFE